MPFILETEINWLKESICGKCVSIIFDGTTHVCEALVIVLRYTEDWVVKQHVCRLMLLAKSLTGEELARQLISAISMELSIPTNRVVAFMRDWAAVNGIAMRTVSVLYSQMLDIGSFLHMFDLVGDCMNTPQLTEFTKLWVSLFSHSPKSRLAW